MGNKSTALSKLDDSTMMAKENKEFVVTVMLLGTGPPHPFKGDIGRLSKSPSLLPIKVNPMAKALDSYLASCLPLKLQDLRLQSYFSNLHEPSHPTHGGIDDTSSSVRWVALAGPRRCRSDS